MKNLDSIKIPKLAKSPKVKASPIPEQGKNVSPVSELTAEFKNLNPDNTASSQTEFTKLPNGVNLLTTKNPVPRKKILKRILFGMLLIIIVLITSLTLRAANLSQKIFVGQKTSFFSKIRDLIRGGDSNDILIGEDLGQINILLLGIGGEGHDGPYLTDTMILAQIRPDIGEVSLISIPRDYWAEIPNSPISSRTAQAGTNTSQNSFSNQNRAKINSAFSEGFVKHHDWDEAGLWARQTVEKLTDEKIPYFAVLDFAGFEKAVNQINGLDVIVERTFTDYSYPDNGIGYLPPITFTAGPAHLNGTRALQFARSRHAAGPEGSDFARSTRQHKIIESFKQKVLSLNLLSDAGTINSLLSTFADHFHTNISPASIFHIYNLIREKGIKSFISLSLDPSTSLVCPKILEESGAYVLTPCEGKTESDIANFFKNAFTYGKVTAEKSVIWLSSSSGNKVSLASAKKNFEDAALTVWELPYKGEALSQNIFYQVNPKPATAEFIKNSLHATEVTLPPPGVKVDNQKVDVIVILGENN